MGRRRSRPRQATLTKAARPGTAMVPAATFTAEQVAALVNAGASTGGQLARPLPRLEPMVPFGPGVPLAPAPIDPLRPATGRAEPRRYEYPVAVNLPGFGERLVPWKVLRDAADGIGLFRRCIEIRKAEVATLDWDVVISSRAIERAQRADGGTVARSEVEQKMRDRLAPEIARIAAWWEQPDPQAGLEFVPWCSQLLEEHFVLDAVAIYPRLTLGGALFGLEVLEGSTIKPLLDHRGARPLPPQPAYQQILYGFPRGEFVADIDADGGVLSGFDADRLVYATRNVRTWTPYGYSSVEQALDDGDLYLRRHGWLKAEYTDGVMPSGWLKTAEGQAEWSPNQLADYERALNDHYSGQTQVRQRYRILPWGMEPVTETGVEAKYRPDYDLHLIKLVAMHFDTVLTELGFSEPKGLGSAGWHEGQTDVQDRKGRQPTLRWLQELLTAVSHRHLGMPAELEFRFLGLESEDEDAADEVAARRVGGGRTTLNEDRDRLGLPRYDFAEADMPMLTTARGVVFLEGASEQAPPGQLVSPGQASPALDQAVSEPAQGGGGQPQPTAGRPARANSTPPGKPAPGAAVKAELVAYRRWARNHDGHVGARPFEFAAVTPDLAKAEGVDLDRVAFKAADAGPLVAPAAPGTAGPATSPSPGTTPPSSGADWWQRFGHARSPNAG